MSGCADEGRTLHYNGSWRGFGPVQDGERVLFAVFEGTPLEGSSILIEKSFSNFNLIRTSESLARTFYVTAKIFWQSIVRRRTIIGIACANVSDLRNLVAQIQPPSGIKQVRAICVVDKVEEGDCDGHAAMGYGEETRGQGMTEGQIGKIRKNIRMDLATKFSTIIPADDHQWPTLRKLLLGRTASIWRVFLAWVGYAQ